MPPAINHVIVAGVCTIAILLGGILIDVDHKGTWKCKWHKFWNINYPCNLGMGIIHRNPTIMFSIIGFSLFFGLSLLFHYGMDMMRFLK